MSDKAGHEAMLYFIEVLMNSSGPLTVAQLAGRFGSRSFTAEMRQAAGSDEDGLRKFLAKYPSLFALDGNSVSINNHGIMIPSVSVEPMQQSADPVPVHVPDPAMEQSAVHFFRDKLSKKGGVLPVKSLAGHLSQASADVRLCVGPQNSFLKFLLKHPDVFCINHETNCVYLPSVGRADISCEKINGSSPVNGLGSSSNGGSGIAADDVEDKSKAIAKESKIVKPSPITMTASEYKTMKFIKDVVERTDGATRLAAIMAEISATGPDAVKNIIGDSQDKLEEFVRKYPNIFMLDGDAVAMKKTRLNVIMAGSRPSLLLQQQVQQLERVSSDADKTGSPATAVAAADKAAAGTVGSGTGSAPATPTTPTPAAAAPARRTYNNHRGPIYHLAKLWGIIDLGKHEHVFFDRSILPDGYDDLSRHFKVGEVLRFNAVRAARGSRARWRATHVWRDGRDIRSMYGADATFTSSVGAVSQSAIDDEVKRVLLPTTCCCCGSGSVGSGNESVSTTPSAGSGAGTAHANAAVAGASGDDDPAYEPYAYSDAATSSAGTVPVWTVRSGSSGEEAAGDGAIPSLSMVPEIRFMQKSSQLDGAPTNLVPSYMLVGGGGCRRRTTDTNGRTTQDVACQTVATGDIMATQFYEEDLSA